MFQDKQMHERKKLDLRKKNLLSWQIILNSSQIAAYIEKKLANQGEVIRGGISRIYLSLSNKWKPCHRAINSQGVHLTLPPHIFLSN